MDLSQLERSTLGSLSSQQTVNLSQWALDELCGLAEANEEADACLSTQTSVNAFLNASQAQPPSYKVQ